MKCQGCGIEVLDTSPFCPYCGLKTGIAANEKNVDNEMNTVNTVAVETEKKVWQTFAKLGYIFGLIGIIVSGASCLLAFSVVGYLLVYIPQVIVLELSTVGIVFSALGKKSVLFNQKANTGLVLNILAVVLGVVSIIIFIVAIVILELSYTIG